MTTPTTVAARLFRPIAPSYERWASVLSMGQDRRWRERLVAGLVPADGTLGLDVAAGTGSITRALARAGHRVIAVDQSLAMLAGIGPSVAPRIAATAEHLPVADASFDVVTFGYLMRYVDDLPAAMVEMTRVTRPGGTVAALEFGRPGGVWRPAWWLYTRLVLPLAGLVIGHGWREVGRFLGPSIDRFWDTHDPQELAGIWERAGLVDVRWISMSLGGGFLMWASRP